MAKSKGITEDVHDENTVRVSSPLSLPYLYIPYASVSEAREKAAVKDSGLDTDKTLYVFEPGKPAGYKIVAYPIQMEKPTEEEEAANE